MKTFLNYDIEIKNNDNLPSYPDPGLEETLDRFLEWVEPLVTKEELNQAKIEINKFKLDIDYDKIKERMYSIAHNPKDSYIFDYWVKCHLQTRDPICPYTSVPILYENPTIKEKDNTEKVAAMVWSISKVYLEFRNNKNGAYSVGKKIYSNDEFYGTLASMNHVRPKIDSMYINSKISRNFLLIHQNNIYIIETIDENYKLKDYGEILNTINTILNRNDEAKHVNINLFSSEPDRDLAGKYLEELLKNDNNIKGYQEIKDAIASINLDSDIPEGHINKLHCACYDKSYFNRIHSKGTQFNIASNGSMSFIIDHTFCDGGIEVYLCNRVHEELDKLEFKYSEGITTYRKLEFVISNQMNEVLKNCFERYKVCMNAFEARVVDFEDVSRQRLKDLGILSGDGFFHIAQQLAQKLTWNEVRNTYISVDCRKFFRGRTEVNRPVTKESIKFVENAANKSATKDMLVDALNAHHKRTKMAQEGYGVNRYLYVLTEVCKEMFEKGAISTLPTLFDNKAFKVIGDNTLSTTSFGNPDMKSLYFPPVQPKGLGIFYKIAEKSFMTITAFNEDVEMLDEFSKNIIYAMNYMIGLF